MNVLNRFIPFLIWPALFIVVFRYFLEIDAGGDSFKTGDWLINYAGGPVRRGLIGSMLFYISDFGLPLKWVTFCVQVAFYFFIFLITQKIYLLRQRGVEWLLFLFSPVFILFPFYEIGGGFRKEIIVFLSFLVLAHSFAKKDVSRKSIISSIVLFFLAVFSHESAALTLPFFGYILLESFRSGQINRRVALISILLFSATALISVLFAIVFPGGAEVEKQICDSIASKGFSSEICGGAVHWLSFDAHYAYQSVVQKLPQYIFVYPPLFVLAIFPILMSDWYKKNAALLLIGFGFIAPLFVMATDWGRWLSIYICFVFATMLAESVWQSISIGKLPILALIVYLTIWNVPNYDAHRIEFGLFEWAVKAYQFVSGSSITGYNMLLQQIPC